MAIVAACGSTANRQEDVDTLPPLALASGDVLFVAASTTLGTGDTAAKNRLTAMGYTVTVKAAASSTTSDATGKVLVVISSTVTSSDVATKFRTVAVPALVWESAVLDDMGMVSTTTTGNFGTTASQTNLTIATPSHPMAAGLSGTVAVTSSATTFSWGKPNANATAIAKLTADATQVGIFGYATGAVMPGLTAPAPRVGFFLSDTNAASLTANGWSLFDAAVAWATGQSAISPTVTVAATDSAAGEPTNPGVFTISRTGSTSASLTVSFSVGGTATSGSDYTALGTSLTIPAGAASATVTISPIDDTASESNETVTLTLTSGTGYTIGSPSSATVNLADNDGAPQVLLVVGNTTLGAGDSAVQNRLVSLGYAVTVKTALAAVTADATGKALVAVSSTGASSDVGTKFRNVTVPVLLWESNLLDDMGMTSTTTGSFGTTSASSVVINLPNHPLAAGLSGTVAVATSSDPLSWGQPGAGAFKVATVSGSTSHAAIFAYEPGADMVGLTAPARRVGFFLSDLTASKLTTSGWSLFDAAVKWAAAPFPARVTNERALILVDERLSSRLGTRINDYLNLAAQKRGFGIALHVISGIDEWHYDFVKSYIKTQRSGATNLEGVLLIGNIKLPTFFQSRTDSADTRIIPRYLEDLDGVFTKRLTDGSTLPICPDPFDNTYNCFAFSFTVPPHDFDFVGKGAAPDPEIWTSYMPVGGVGSDTFDDFANQIRPYLDKVLRYYNGQITSNGRFYFLTADIGEEPEKFWNAFGNTKFDLYGKPGPNGEKDSACITSTGENLCYVRWPSETYTDMTTFINTVRTAEQGLGDVSWMDPNILIQHMSEVVYDVIEINQHSSETVSIASSSQIFAMTKAGLLVTLDGCSVSGYQVPRSPSFNNAASTVATNVTMSYLYGASQALAVSGEPFLRGHYAKHPNMYLYMKTTPGAYLGAAHLARNKEQYQKSSDDTEFRENAMEMLAGDPFMTLSP